MSAVTDANEISDAVEVLVQSSGEVGGVLLRSTVAPALAGGGVVGIPEEVMLSCGERARYLISISAGEEAGGVKTRLVVALRVYIGALVGLSSKPENADFIFDELGSALEIFNLSLVS
jgi:hypothetical protein